MRDPKAFHLHARRHRALGALGVVCVMLASLNFVFFRTQVVRNPAYAMQSDLNRLRPLTLPAPRGTIVDRHGRILADNVPGFALSLLPAPRDSIRSTLERLRPLLGLTEAQIESLMTTQSRAPQQQLTVSSDLSFDHISIVEERRPLFPEVLIEMEPKRHYPGGRAVAHLMGYISEISARELADTAFAEYRPGRLVGKTGVERQHERHLAGTPGVRYLEVDALGRVVAEFEGYGEIEASPGRDLQLTVDLGLQHWIHEMLADTVRGAVVALEPATGEVLALYSAPTFDPNDLVGTVDPDEWAALQQDTARRLLDRALAGAYPPGSTWKLATAAVALELDIVEPESVLPLTCRGGMQYGNRYFNCWKRSGHGQLTLADALKHSCNVYFYQLGLQIGMERLLAEGVRLGFDGRSGIDLPGERPGLFPGGLDWYERRFGRSAMESEVLSLAIGQGANDQTPLKMAQFFAALATDGRMPVPRVTRGVPQGAAKDLEVSDTHLDELREGLRRVTEPGGTAAGSALEHWDWMGKTGTSQNPHGPDHGWFVGIAGPPGDDPEIVVAAIIEGGEHGSDVAQIAAKAADYYLRTTRSMPIDTIQTLREHWQNGIPARWAQWD